ncbi:MAG: hypothetical protein ACRDTC_01600 [Pseudonocardiaceae bacterium]
MARHGNPASDNGRPTNTPYDHSKTKDVQEAGSGKHSDEDTGSKDTGEDTGGQNEK